MFALAVIVPSFALGNGPAVKVSKGECNPQRQRVRLGLSEA